MLAFAMPVALSRAQVEAIAMLARLELTPAEIDLFARQLGDILDHVDQLQRIDTTGVPPTSTIDAPAADDRPDEVRASLDRADALANAPDPAPEAGLFRVPRVIG
jgi:aspartyl-tRNA(Asn)/glutamyl-tRNA(Gln) amidotransferase subunit C